MSGKDFGVPTINIRKQEPWFKDILTCLLESIFFIKSSGDTVVEEKVFKDLFTYPKVKNDAELDEQIKGYLSGKLSFEEGKIGNGTDDNFYFTVKFANRSGNYERWKFSFKVKTNVSEDDVKGSLKDSLDYISKCVLEEGYVPLEELDEPTLGHSIKYDVEVEENNFPKKSTLFPSSFTNITKKFLWS